MYWAFTGGQYYERNVAFWIERLLSLAAAPILHDIGATTATTRWSPRRQPSTCTHSNR